MAIKCFLSYKMGVVKGGKKRDGAINVVKYNFSAAWLWDVLLPC